MGGKGRRVRTWTWGKDENHYITLKRMLQQQQQQPILIDVAFSDGAEGSVGSILAHPFDELDWHFNRLLTVGGVYSMSAWASALAASVLFQARRMVRGMDPSPSNVTMSRDKNNAHVTKKIREPGFVNTRRISLTTNWQGCDSFKL